MRVGFRATTNPIGNPVKYRYQPTSGGVGQGRYWRVLRHQGGRFLSRQRLQGAAAGVAVGVLVTSGAALAYDGTHLRVANYSSPSVTELPGA